MLWYLYAKKNKTLFNKSYFIFSFDCDTEEDINVALEVHIKLQNLGITPVYAVPGALLQKGASVYKKILQTGAEFINHGGREHTYFDAMHKRYASCFFYDKQPLELVREDIISGDKILQDVLGIKPQGWRTPHFGTFQKREYIGFLYAILKELNYKFSTSTVPAIAYKNGSIYKQQGIIEIPVTGVFAEPLNIFDTWAYFGAPDKIHTGHEYYKECELFAKFADQYPILINIYGDPSHIYNQPAFFQAMKSLAHVADNINYTQLLELTHDNLRHF